MVATATVSPPKIRQTKILIDGKFRDSISGKTFATINPATEQNIADVAEGDAADVDLAAQAARRAFEQGPWSRMDARERGNLMFKLADLIQQNFDELAALETLDNGKPIRDSRAWDIPATIATFRYYAGWADKIHGDVIPVANRYFTYTRREPVGVAGQIIPWNYPLCMLAWKWGPALVAGCTVVLKPAEQTPLSALRVGELAMEAGFPPGVINIVPGYGPSAGAAIVRHPLVDKIAFTGEWKTAQLIMREAAEGLKRLTFELGGKSPNIIFADADMSSAVDGAYGAIFSNQGQNCCAGSRVFVEERVHDEFIDQLSSKAQARKIGDPFDPSSEHGPQVDRDQFDKIMHYIKLGNDQGARCASGGQRVGERGFFVQPTVFSNVRDEMAIATDEIFGPVVSVLKFKDIQEVAQRANNTPYGLAAAVWTRDVNKAHQLSRKIRAGTVWVNCYNIVDPATPFGGFKRSGIGRELGVKAIDNYTEIKTVTMDIAGDEAT
jgi:aldehyde dehydrogenase (NAD+)